VTTKTILALGGLLASALSAQVTLRDYAQRHSLTVYTVGQNPPPPLAPDDQTNNQKDGDKILPLSGVGLTSLDGIAGLRVMDQGKSVRLAAVERLQIFLNHNALTALPAEFFTLHNVTFVYLYYNQFDAIPPEIAKMKGLLGMYWTGNRIPRIPPEVFTMTQLKKLQVSKNLLTEIPAAIGNLTELRHLSLADNQIEVLPPAIARLKRLRVCDFSNNRIRRLPEEFGSVRIVHQLRVCNNPLTTLPAGFAGMPGSIDITGTKIAMESLPPALRAQIGREKR
jgi:Leucine-rich repeat (LRR) protein